MFGKALREPRMLHDLRTRERVRESASLTHVLEACRGQRRHAWTHLSDARALQRVDYEHFRHEVPGVT